MRAGVGAAARLRFRRALGAAAPCRSRHRLARAALHAGRRPGLGSAFRHGPGARPFASARRRRPAHHGTLARRIALRAGDARARLLHGAAGRRGHAAEKPVEAGKRPAGNGDGARGRRALRVGPPGLRHGSAATRILQRVGAAPGSRAGRGGGRHHAFHPALRRHARPPAGGHRYRRAPAPARGQRRHGQPGATCPRVTSPPWASPSCAAGSSPSRTAIRRRSPSSSASLWRGACSPARILSASASCEARGASGPPWSEARDVTNLGAGRESWPEFYIPRQHVEDFNFQNQEPPVGWRAAVVIARTAVDPKLAAASLRGILSSLDRTLPVEIETMRARLEQIDQRPRFCAFLLGIRGNGGAGRGGGAVRRDVLPGDAAVPGDRGAPWYSFRYGSPASTTGSRLPAPASRPRWAVP
jgi:hypothetical protein